ncbi:MAG: BamA/TamA family outer membrane protein [Myxococcota bacterium]
MRRRRRDRSRIPRGGFARCLCAVALALVARPAAPAEAPTPEKKQIRYELESVELRGNKRTRSSVILRYVPFRAGDVLDVEDPELELIRYRLLGTGFFSSAQVSLRRGSKRGRAVLTVSVEERNTLIVENVAMGIAADEDTDGNSQPISPFVGLSGAETNLAGTGIAVGAGFAAAADQYALQTRFADASLFGTAWRVDAELHYIDARDFFGSRDVRFESPALEQRQVTDYAVVAYRRYGGTVGTGYELGIPLTLRLAYQLDRVEAVMPTVASHIRGETREPIEIAMLPGGSFVSAIQGALVYDTRDAPFLPRRGILAELKAKAATSPFGSSYTFGKLETHIASWHALPWRHVIAFRGGFGAIAGDAPFFEQFYVGDYSDLLPDRILGLSPDRRQPPNLFDTSIIEIRYGQFAAKVETEYRIPLYTGGSSIYGIDFFGALGLYGVANERDFRDPPSGYNGLSRVPVDLTYNLGLRVETYLGGFSVAFSNLFGLLPGQGGARK